MRMHVVLTCFSFFLVLSASANEPLGWKPHTIKQGDGRGGWVERPLLFGLPAGLAMLALGAWLLWPRTAITRRCWRGTRESGFTFGFAVVFITKFSLKQFF